MKECVPWAGLGSTPPPPPLDMLAFLWRVGQDGEGDGGGGGILGLGRVGGGLGWDGGE